MMSFVVEISDERLVPAWARTLFYGVRGSFMSARVLRGPFKIVQTKNGVNYFGDFGSKLVELSELMSGNQVKAAFLFDQVELVEARYAQPPTGHLQLMAIRFKEAQSNDFG